MWTILALLFAFAWLAYLRWRLRTVTLWLARHIDVLRQSQIDLRAELPSLIAKEIEQNQEDRAREAIARANFPYDWPAREAKSETPDNRPRRAEGENLGRGFPD